MRAHGHVTNESAFDSAVVPALGGSRDKAYAYTTTVGLRAAPSGR